MNSFTENLGYDGHQNRRTLEKSLSKELGIKGDKLAEIKTGVASGDTFAEKYYHEPLRILLVSSIMKTEVCPSMYL